MGCESRWNLSSSRQANFVKNVHLKVTFPKTSEWIRPRNSRQVVWAPCRVVHHCRPCWRLARRSKIVGFRRATCRSIRTFARALSSFPTRASAKDNGVALEPIADMVRCSFEKPLSFDDVRAAASGFATAPGQGPNAAVATANGHQQRERRGRAIFVHSATPDAQAKQFRVHREKNHAHVWRQVPCQTTAGSQLLSAATVHNRVSLAVTRESQLTHKILRIFRRERTTTLD